MNSHPTPRPQRADCTLSVPHPALAVRRLNYSQRNGHSPLPQMSPPGELPQNSRTAIWNALYKYMVRRGPYGIKLPQSSLAILESIFADFFNGKLNHYKPSDTLRRIEAVVESSPAHEVMRIVEMILRHTSCPIQLKKAIAVAFRRHHLAYRISFDRPLMIVPISNDGMGMAVPRALADIRNAGFNPAGRHLEMAIGFMHKADHASVVRESVHAVESVTRTLTPGSASLGAALTALEKHGQLHRALKKGMAALYGYASDEQGIRHALRDKERPDVAAHEAMLVLGICSSLCGYLANRAPRKVPA